MSAVAESHQSYDLGDVPLIVRSSIKLGIITAIVVFAFSLVSRYLSGTVEMALEALLQRIGTYTNRWLEIGGGSNWWYHPVWWMTGTYLAWMGAVVLANQASGTGSPSIPKMTATAIVFGSVVAVVAVIIGFPGAAWSFPTFGIALLPGFAIAALFSMMSRRRA